jgi:hypothetical protein
MWMKLLHSSGAAANQNARAREISEASKKLFRYHGLNQIAWMVRIAAVEHHLELLRPEFKRAKIAVISTFVAISSKG